MQMMTARGNSTSNPLTKIDSLLNEWASQAKPREHQQLAELRKLIAEEALTYLSIPQRNWRNDPVQSLFDDSLPHTSRQFIVACLVRMLTLCPDAFTEVGFRNRAFGLFDSVLGMSLYPRLKIKEKDPTHQKETALTTTVREAERDLDNAVNALVGIRSVSQFEKDFFDVYRRAAAQILIAPFLPKYKIESGIHALISSVSSYVSALPSQVVSKYEDVVQSAAKLIGDAEAVGTKYSHDYILKPVAMILAAIQRDFDASPLRTNPVFRVTKSDKKYPFHSTAPIKLEIEIENIGPGYAAEVEVGVPELSVGTLRRNQFQVGDMAPSRRVVLAELTLDHPVSEVIADVRLTWVTFDREQHQLTATLEFTAQRSDIDWAGVAISRPYDEEPVENDSELIGRAEILQQLLGMTSGSKLGSAIVSGQKRVGKTSIVKALQSRLAKVDPSVTSIYVLAGDYVVPDPIRTIQALGTRLCEEIKEAHPDISDLKSPDFVDALSPLGDFIRRVQKRNSKRFLFVLDEFDEIPTDLYSQNNVANAFFLTIRSLSAKPEVGFMLVGSERMSAMMISQGQNLNKFKAVRVDYFDRQAHWPDFVDLVRRPTEKFLEFTDKAVELIYNFTLGNPYFTNLICKSILKTMVNRRDAHVTPSEVEEACITELKNVDVNSFVHFWEDGIIEKGAERESALLIRRKILLAFGEVLRRDTAARVSLKQVQLAAQQYELTDDVSAREVSEFVERQVIERQEDSYKVKVRFFSEWLRDFGVSKILSTLSDRIATLDRRASDQAYVRSEEIFSVAQKLGRYKGQPITADHIRVWLNQFGPNPDQRLMFKLLKNLRFFSESEIRARLADIQAMISRVVVPRFKHGVGRSEDLAVSYLEGPGKSGFQYARLFAEENRIITRNVVEPEKIETLLGEKPIKAVLWVDDFIGTGDTAISRFKEQCEGLQKLQRSSGVEFFFAAISGLEESQARIQTALDKMGLKVAVRICEPLSERDRCFSQEASIFVDDDERDRAKRIAEDTGRRLYSRHPLGFGGCETAVVFERSCPNNSLPIFWSSSPGWTPLFPR